MSDLMSLECLRLLAAEVFEVLRGRSDRTPAEPFPPAGGAEDTQRSGGVQPRITRGANP
jgi:hypothetical protein